MKKLFLLAASAAVLCGFATAPEYAIEGDIPALEGTVYLFGAGGDSPIDSAVVEKGRFRFTGSAETPSLRILSDRRTRGARLAQVFIEPGTITIGPNPDHAEGFIADGTPANDAANAYELALEALAGEYRDGSANAERAATLETESDRLADRTIAENRDNFFGVTLLSQQTYRLSGGEILDRIARFSPEMQATPEMIELRATARQLSKTEADHPYIDIVQRDPDGREISLSSIVGKPKTKYVLVDFWASWAPPCMREVLDLKDVYQKFHRKGFEIYGVSLDENRDQWLRAIRKNGMNWIQVNDPAGWECRAAQDYVVRAVPANVLIDAATGQIVSRDLSGDDLDATLGELLRRK